MELRTPQLKNDQTLFKDRKKGATKLILKSEIQKVEAML